MRKRSLMLAVGLGMALTLTLATSPALALSLTGNYFTLSATHPDTLGGVDGVTVTGLVAPALVGGLPVYTGVIPPASGAITDLGAGNTIQWWTAHGTTVTTDIVRVDSFNGVLGGGAFASNFFPNGHANDASGYRSVHWTGAFHVGAAGATLHLSADDDAWLFLNGNRVLDNGGVKAIGLATTSTTTLVAGDYNVDLFFADRHVIQSGIVFDCDGCLDPVPEPATLLLFGTTLAGLGAVVRRRLKGQSKAEA
jgi:fibro-slime domain-containing protein